MSGTELAASIVVTIALVAMVVSTIHEARAIVKGGEWEVREVGKRYVGVYRDDRNQWKYVVTFFDRNLQYFRTRRMACAKTSQHARSAKWERDRLEELRNAKKVDCG